MAIRMADHIFGARNALRYQPITNRIRAMVGEQTVVDSTRAVLVWEPRRIVPAYAVPVDDIQAPMVPVETSAVPEDGDGPPVLDPRNPFLVHTSQGESRTVRTAARELPAAAFAPADPDLAGYALLDWAAFDRWLDEDEELVAHPRDPFKRIDTRRSSRHVVIEVDGETVAESDHPVLLAETHLPTRYYLPASDVNLDLLSPTDFRTACAYKGIAQYWTGRKPGSRELAWTYRDPLLDAVPVRNMIAFFNERVDITVDGQRQERPITPWS